jgi:ABC-type glycerol-3-phosphate transport system substrate-binding protein
MKKIKRIFSALLGMAMLISLVGCSSGEKQSDTQEESAQEDTIVYEPTYSGISEEVNSPVIIGSWMYASCWSYDEEKDTSCYTLTRWNLDTMEMEQLPYQQTGGVSIGSMTGTPDGNLLLLLNDYQDGGRGYYLEILNGDGESLSQLDIQNIIEDYSTDSEWGDAYPEYIAADGQGNLYVYLSGMDENLVVLDAQGNKKFDLTVENWCQDMTAGADGKVYVLGYDDTSNNYALKAVDTDKGSWGETYGGIPNGSGSLYMRGEDETHFLISSGDILYRYDLTSKTVEKVLSWLDLDLNVGDMQTFAKTEDGRFLVINYNWDDDTFRNELVLLTPKKASEVKQKTTITYGTVYLSYDLREQIIAFNKSSENYHIEVKEYTNMVSTSDDTSSYENAINSLNADLAAGNAPDLIDLTNLNVASYTGKGVFVDLYELMDKDASVSRDDFVANALSVYEDNGKLYGIPLSFNISTLMGRTSLLHGLTGWTTEQVQEILSEQPEGTEFIRNCSRESLIYMLVAYQLDHYVDWTSGTCNFNSEEFINTLKFVGEFPSYEDMDYDYDEEGTYSAIHNNRALVTDLNIESPGWFLVTLAMYDNDDVTCIGYPTADGSNGSILSSNDSLAITASSKNQEGAWEFIKYVTMGEYQTGLGWGYPILQTAFDNMLNEYMTDKYEGNGYGYDDFDYELVPATREQMDQLREIIDMAKPSNQSTDDNITDIISEEAQAYFDGQKTAEAVAEIIQSRVAIYVSENQ